MKSRDIFNLVQIRRSKEFANRSILSEHLDLHLKVCQVGKKTKTAKNIFGKSPQLRHKTFHE